VKALNEEKGGGLVEMPNAHRKKEGKKGSIKEQKNKSVSASATPNGRPTEASPPVGETVTGRKECLGKLWEKLSEKERERSSPTGHKRSKCLCDGLRESKDKKFSGRIFGASGSNLKEMSEGGPLSSTRRRR